MVLTAVDGFGEGAPVVDEFCIERSAKHRRINLTCLGVTDPDA